MFSDAYPTLLPPDYRRDSDFDESVLTYMDQSAVKRIFALSLHVADSDTAILTVMVWREFFQRRRFSSLKELHLPGSKESHVVMNHIYAGAPLTGSIDLEALRALTIGGLFMSGTQNTLRWLHRLR